MNTAATLRVLAATLAVCLAACTRAPSLEGRSRTEPSASGSETRLGRAITRMSSGHAGESGFIALRDGPDAFAARMRLADVAERSLDIQYYIWHDDLTGVMLFDAVRRAAERGVRVRLLLDDNDTAGLDPLLSELDAHPLVEVRLFNPYIIRRWRWLNVLDFPRLNRRMHNKSFTADGQVTIVGGRNIGDEYFGLSPGVLFVDLDVMAAGKVAGDVAREFERYWASASSYPADRILPARNPAAPAVLAPAMARVEQDPAAAAYRKALEDSPFVQDLVAGQPKLQWSRVVMVSDDPAKGLGLASDDSLVWPQLRRIAGPPRESLLLVSPYFVPGESGVATFSELSRQGVKISVVTNSLEATDVAAVHAGYSKRREALLAAGVKLYEMKREFAQPAPRARIRAGSSASSLHAKTFAIDGARVFVGSLNFDPRSARLNTEMGFVIESPALAAEMATIFASVVPQRAYEVRLDNGELRWLEAQSAGRPRVYTTEPGTTLWRRAIVRLTELLPIDWLL